MFAVEDTRDPTAVAHEVQLAYLEMFPEGDRLFVPRNFGLVIDCFCGGHPGFQSIDTRYHDVEHTLQGTLCMTRILRRRHALGAEPRLPRRLFELGLLAILLHDTGYLKRRDDREGTGAKYTPVHVQRSADFAAECLPAKGFSPPEIRAIQHMIQCTGVGSRPREIPFQSEEEKLVGCALATGDLLGQMAAADYVDKLPILYEEFAEAAVFNEGRTSALTTFDSAEELIRKTPEFWENYVKPRLDHELEGLHRFLNDPYPDGPNPYWQRIEANIARIRGHSGPGKARRGEEEASETAARFPGR
jgi:hypothetical protein